MDPLLLSALIGFIAAVLPAYYAYKQSVKVAQQVALTNIKKVDADAYERARESYEAALATQQNQIDAQNQRLNQLHEQVNEMQRQLNNYAENERRLMQELEALRAENVELKRINRDLQDRIDELARRTTNIRSGEDNV